METAFSFDFAAVRVHTGTVAMGVPALSHQPLAIARQDDLDAGTTDVDAAFPARTGTGPADATPQVSHSQLVSPVTLRRA